MPHAAGEADAALLIWLFIDSHEEHRFRARLTATRGLDPGTYRRLQAHDVDGVCEIVRTWLQAELDRKGDDYR